MLGIEIPKKKQKKSRLFPHLFGFNTRHFYRDVCTLHGSRCRSPNVFCILYVLFFPPFFFFLLNALPTVHEEHSPRHTPTRNGLRGIAINQRRYAAGLKEEVLPS